MAAGTPSHFFTLIYHSTLQDKKLGIPREFVKKFGNELSTVATLEAPNGRIWNVELMKDGRNIWFHVGWVEFVEHHSISNGYFLLFRYLKKSTFHVLIFNMSACEIRYPHYCVERKNDNQDEIEDEDSVELIASLTPKPHASDSTLEINSSRKYNTSLESQIFRRGYEVRSKRRKMEVVVDLNESDSISDVSEYELLDILEEMGIYVKINFQYITAEEKLRAIAAARLFKPKNPSFMVILRHRDIYTGNMYVPLEFSKKYLINRDTELIKLHDRDGKEWSVELSRYRPKGGGGDLKHGWTKFSKEKNLNEGDICMFELIRKKNIVLKVSVFRSSTNIF